MIISSRSLVSNLLFSSSCINWLNATLATPGLLATTRNASLWVRRAGIPIASPSSRARSVDTIGTRKVIVILPLVVSRSSFASLRAASLTFGPARCRGALVSGRSASYTAIPLTRYDRHRHKRKRPMGPKLVDYLLYEPEDNGILWIKFNRPERMNALVGTAEENSTVAKVGEYMRAGDDDPKVRVIVLTGVGRGFCSGANLASRAGPDVTGENLIGNRAPHEGPDGARQHFYHGFTALHRDISLIRKPTIAMINGPAVGSGMDMSLHCDIRIGCEKTRFIAYHNAGPIIENGGSDFLPEKGWLRRALGVVFNREMGAQRGVSGGQLEHP